MPKQEVKKAKPDYDDSHHKPRSFNKKKQRKTGFSEDVVANRKARIGFKTYLQELEENELDDQLDDLE